VFAAGLVACAPLVMAQVGGGSPQTSASASSDAGITSGSAASPAKPIAPKLAGSNKARSPRVLGRVAGESSPLCFQPGVGWLPAPQAASGSAGHSVIRASTSSIAGAHPFGTSQRISGQCGSSPPSSAAVEALKSSTPSSWRSATKLVSHPASLSQSAESADPAEAVQAFGNHAYISPIKLRRMMRNAPDLETRMKLQEISDRLANNKGNSFAGYEEGKGGQGKRIPGFQVNRGSPSMPARGRKADSHSTRAGYRPAN
jgi:hypothetical protein